MGIARTRPSRFLKEVVITPANLPANVASAQLTLEVTGLPTRGILRRVTTVFESATAWGAVSDAGAWFVHTAGTPGSSNLSSVQANTIFGVSPFNPLAADAYGGQLDLVDTSEEVWCQTLNFNGSTMVSQDSKSGGDQDPYYDVSGGVLGPDANDGTLYFTIIVAGAALATGAGYSGVVTNAKIRLEIEPCF